MPSCLIRPAFTTTEILIVIGIIVLVLALAVPAFNFITGSRSVDSAQNLVSAMLGSGRIYAMREGRYAGVAFFVNPADGRSTMALVQGPAVNLSSYEAWSPMAIDGSGSYAATQYRVGEEVVAPVADGTTVPPIPTGTTPPPTEGKVIVSVFTCIQDHVASTSNQPPNSTYWQQTLNANADIDLVPDTDFQGLPTGVGAQLINDPKNAVIPGLNKDRYLRTGVIMFDPKGRMASVDWQLRGQSALGKLLGVDTLPVAQQIQPPPGGGTVLKSELGVALYDLQAFKNQSGFTEQDFVIDVPSLGPKPGSPGTVFESAEEPWLDANALTFYVDRYNGTLMKGE